MSTAPLPSLEVRWQRFEQLMFSDIQVTNAQRIETRRAFYAGMLEMFMTIQQEVATLPEADMAAALDHFSDQFGDYRDELVTEARAHAQRAAKEIH